MASFLHQSCQSVTMGNLFIFWGFHRFLSSSVWSYCHIGLSLVLVRANPRYFILFVAIMKGVVSLIFLIPLILCIKEGCWFELILYSATLLKSFISRRSYMMESLVLPVYTIILSTNMPVLICITLTSFSSPVTLATTSSTILNK